MIRYQIGEVMVFTRAGTKIYKSHFGERKTKNAVYKVKDMKFSTTTVQFP